MRKVNKDDKRKKVVFENYISEYERGDKYRTDEMNKYKDDYINDDY